jgi:ribosomal protein S18 acetylase RimI-like enzyme
MTPVTFRIARPDDAAAVAALHADSWRKHYRGAYSDAYLDGDVVSDRIEVWAHRLSNPAGTETHLAESNGELVGFVHTVLDADETWGALLDNLHVLSTHHRSGIGAALMAHSARFVVAEMPDSKLYLWVLEQNVRAQRFYEAQGGQRADSARVSAVDRVADHPDGAPRCFRYVWRDPSSVGQLTGTGSR